VLLKQSKRTPNKLEVKRQSTVAVQEHIICKGDTHFRVVRILYVR